MSKTFGQLKAGDEVYIIKDDCSVEIVKVQSTATKQYHTYIKIDGWTYRIPVGVTFHSDRGDIYCDIDEAIKAMKEICEKALHDYREASGALNKLETKKKMI